MDRLSGFSLSDRPLEPILPEFRYSQRNGILYVSIENNLKFRKKGIDARMLVIGEIRAESADGRVWKRILGFFLGCVSDLL
jgi:hypothetical protein